MSDTMNIVNIDIDKIKSNPDNAKIFSMNNIEELANSIKENGFIGAINVYDLGDGTYEIFSGHRRFEAQKYLKKKTIPAFIDPLPSEENKAKNLIDSNLHNRELTIMDKARALVYYQDKVLTKPGLNKNEELCKKFGISMSQVKYLKRIVTYSDKIQKLIENGNIQSYNGLQNLNKLNSSEQDAVADKLLALTSEYDDGVIPFTRIKLIVDNAVKEKESAKTNTTTKQFNSDITDSPAKIVKGNNDSLSSTVKSKIGITFNDNLNPDFSEGLFTPLSYESKVSDNDEQVYADDELISGIKILKSALNKKIKFDVNEYISEIENILKRLKSN